MKAATQRKKDGEDRESGDHTHNKTPRTQNNLIIRSEMVLVGDKNVTEPPLKLRQR